MTIRRIDTAPVPMAALKATPATGSFAEQVEFVLGERRQVRFLKRTGEYGRLALLTARMRLHLPEPEAGACMAS